MTGEKPPAGPPVRNHLEAALRANLQRRKAQAQARQRQENGGARQRQERTEAPNPPVSKPSQMR